MYFPINVNKKTDILLAVLSGILLVLGFQPIDLYIFPWAALVPLLIALRDKAPMRSFALGLLTGFVWFAGTIYWIFHSVYYYGNIPASISVLMVVVLCLYLGSYVGLFSVLYNAVSKGSRLPSTLSVPLLWVALEFMRTYVLTGFPWALLAYSQYKLLPLIQIADITGVYGVSFIVAAGNGLIFDVISSENRRRPAAAAAVFTVVTALSLVYGYGKLDEQPGGREINVSVIQGNIPQDKKWDARFQKDVLETYRELSLEALTKAPDMIVWPETALPFVLGYDNELTKETFLFAKELKTYLLFGSMVLKRTQPADTRITNSAVMLSPAGEPVSFYDKMHLVPYGEYVPFREFIPFAKRLAAGIGDFDPGEETLVMETPFAKIGNLICYEIIFPGLVRKFVEKGADVLVTITNDAWFGRTSAPYQHFVTAVFRAVENRVPVIRAANTGISGFIDTGGRITNTSEIFVEAVLNEKVRAGETRTVYTEYGDIFAWLCAGGAILLVIYSIPFLEASSSKNF